MSKEIDIKTAASHARPAREFADSDTGRVMPCEMWTEQDVARYLKCSVHKLRNDRWAGVGLPYHKYGRLIRYDPNEVRASGESYLVRPQKCQRGNS